MRFRSTSQKLLGMNGHSKTLSKSGISLLIRKTKSLASLPKRWKSTTIPSWSEPVFSLVTSCQASERLPTARFKSKDLSLMSDADHLLDTEGYTCTLSQLPSTRRPPPSKKSSAPSKSSSSQAHAPLADLAAATASFQAHSANSEV